MRLWEMHWACASQQHGIPTGCAQWVLCVSALQSIPFYVSLFLLHTHSLIHFLNVCNDSFPCHFISNTLHFCLALSADCCGCGKEFKNEQSLVALDKHWHLGCFKCKVCNKVLNAEYISKLVPLLLFSVCECVDGCLCVIYRSQ